MFRFWSSATNSIHQHESLAVLMPLLHEAHGKIIASANWTYNKEFNTPNIFNNRATLMFKDGAVIIIWASTVKEADVSFTPFTKAKVSLIKNGYKVRLNAHISEKHTIGVFIIRWKREQFPRWDNTHELYFERLNKIKKKSKQHL